MQNEDAVAPIPDDLREAYDDCTWDGTGYPDFCRALIERIGQSEQRAEKAEAENTRLQTDLATATLLLGNLKPLIDHDHGADCIWWPDEDGSNCNCYLAKMLCDIEAFLNRAALNPPTSTTEE